MLGNPIRNLAIIRSTQQPWWRVINANLVKFGAKTKGTRHVAVRNTTLAFTAWGSLVHLIPSIYNRSYILSPENSSEC